MKKILLISLITLGIAGSIKADAAVQLDANSVINFLKSDAGKAILTSEIGKSIIQNALKDPKVQEEAKIFISKNLGLPSFVSSLVISYLIKK